MTYVVTAPLITVVASGVRHSLYTGALIPSGVKGEDIERLSREGYIAESVSEKASEPVEKNSSGEPSAIPAKAGPGSGKAAWRGYAESLGVDAPESVDRDDLIKAIAAAGHPTE